MDGYINAAVESCENLNILWGYAAIEELLRCGVTMFFVCPGSRSTPLAVAVLRHGKARWASAHDERGAGFLAVGYARGDGLAAVITSSGTAVANLWPAAVEAYQDGLPMIFLTADRPPELKENGANQSINQEKILGDYVNWYKNIPCPSEAIPLRNLVSDVDYAVAMATGMTTGGNCGVAHLNFMFREPLAPTPEPWSREVLFGLEKWMESSTRPFTVYPKMSVTVSAMDVATVLEELRESRRGLVIVGQLAKEDRDPTKNFLTKLGWPYVCDILSGVSGTFPNMEILLRNSKWAELACPDCVLQFGGRLVSTRLTQFLAGTSRQRKSYILIDERRTRFDEHFTVTCRLHVSPSVFCKSVNFRTVKIQRSEMEEVWYMPNLVEEQLSVRLEDEAKLNEPSVARILSRSRIPWVFLGNSMPIRDMSAFAFRGAKTVYHANRGASGIDGVLSSAIGLSIALRAQVALLVGDMSFIHDLNALHLLGNKKAWNPEMKIPRVMIIVLNNGGGGIFSFLPLAQQEHLLSPLFSTPHSTSFRDVCQGFGIRFTFAQTTGNLREILATEKESCVIEVTTDRRENVELHSNLMNEIASNIYLGE